MDARRFSISRSRRWASRIPARVRRASMERTRMRDSIAIPDLSRFYSQIQPCCNPGNCPGADKPFSIIPVPGLDTPVMYVRGVGPRVAQMLAAKGIQTAEDLLYHLPFRY